MGQIAFTFPACMTRNHGIPMSRVLLLVGAYGERTEPWVHRHATGLARHECHVAALRRVNAAEFPHPRLTLLDGTSLIGHRLLQVRCAVATLRWPASDTLRAWRLRRLLLGLRPRLLHVHFLWNAPLACAAAAGLDVPIVVTAHGTDVNAARTNPAYRERLGTVFERVHTVLAVSDFIAGKLVEIGCPTGKIVRLYLGAPVPARPVDLSRAADAVNVICVGAFKPVKGHVPLLRAFAQARAQMPGLTLTLIGDGVERASIERLIAELGLAGCVRLAGFLPHHDVQQHLLAAAICVQPSLIVNAPQPDGTRQLQEEGLPIAAVEAASYGLPLVATRTGGLPEICRDGTNGLLVEPEDVTGLAEALARLAREPALRARLGQAGRDLVQREFEIGSQLAELEQLYARVGAG